MALELENKPRGADDEDDVPRVLGASRSRADRIYRGLTRGSGFTTLVIMGLIGTFLFLRAWPALSEAGLGFVTTFEWRPDDANPTFGIASIVADTLMVSVIALFIAVPASIALALYINEFAPRPMRRGLTSMVDLLAAIPSIVYGLWGRNLLQPNLVPVSEWLSRNLGFIPIFEVESGRFDSSRFIGGVVLSIMVLPIATSVMREVFSQTPPSEKEAALALGGTRWGMIRSVVLPFGRGGIIGGSMLALGRALGETVAVALILAPQFDMNGRVLENGGSTIASLIAIKFGEAQELGLSALMAAGLTLFLITLFVNLIASAIVSRSRSGAGVEL